MQDLMQAYASDLNKLRDAFHNELTATAEELSKAMAFYASRSDAALASFMEKATARGRELEGAAAARPEPVLRSSGKRRSAERR
jgi:hypothetical protein